MADLFSPLYLPGADAEKLNPSFKQTMSSAFRLENDVVNMYDWLTRPVFEPDPEFDFKATFKAKRLPLDFMPMLAGSHSQAEFDATLGRIQKEYQDKAVLAASGWGGTVAALSAGVLSPTAFIPFVGQARGGKAVAQMLGLAAAGATAQNAALFLNQETRTEAELYGGIAMDTLLMGLMGGAYFRLTKAGRAQLAADIPYNQKFDLVPEGPADVAPVAERKVRVEDPVASEVKREVRELGIRDPETVQDMLDEVEVGPTALRDKALQIGEVTRKTAKSSEEQLEFGKSFLEVPIAQGVVARFSKVPAGSGGKWFVGGEYAITLRTTDGQEISIPSKSVDSHNKAGNTGIDKEAELKQAIAEGRLDDQFYEMLEAADEPTGMASPDTGRTIPNLDDTAGLGRGADGKSVGAASVRTRNTLGAKAAPSKARQVAMNVLGKMSPAYRMLTQPFFASMRDAAAKLDMAGIQQAGLKTQQPSASGGTVIERIRGYDAYLVTLFQKVDQAFYDYIYDGAKGLDYNSPALTQLKSIFSMTPKGKMSWPEFKAAVFEAHNVGGEIPAELAPAAQAFKEFFQHFTDRQAQYMAEFQAMGMDVPPLFKELEADELGEGVSQYAHHIFDQQKLMENMGEFIQEFAAAHEKQLLESFAKARTRHAKRKAKLEFERLIAKLEPAELNARLVEVEGDLELIEQLPEWQAVRQERLDLNKQARDEGWSAEALKKAQKDLQERQPDAFKELQLERKQHMATAKALRKYGADAEKKTAELQAAIAKLDDSIDGMFRETMPKIAAADISIANIQAKGEKALAPVTAGIKRIVSELGKRQARMSKLLASKRTNSASRQKVADLVEKSKAKYAGMLERLAIVEGKQVALDQRLSELQLLREDAIADATQLVRSRAARLADLEDKLESGPATALTPEERARMFDQVGEDMEKLDADFADTWYQKGERSGDPLTTKEPDFREQAVASATMLHQKLTGGEVELAPAYHLLRQDARGAELLRVMKLPFDMKKKWLVNDIELVAKVYDRTMAPDLEIWRAFDGSVNGKSVLAEMQEEVTAQQARIALAKYVKLPKGWVDEAAKLRDKVTKRLAEAGDATDVHLGEKNFSDQPGEGFVEITPELRSQLGRSVADAAEAVTRDFDVAIQRLRRTRGAPQNGGSGWWRAGRFIKNMNVMTMMGGVLTSSISDIARPIWQHGVRKTLGQGWVPFIKRTTARDKQFRLRSKEINRRIGLNLEPVLHSRAQAAFDLADETIGRTRVERAANVGAQKMGLIAFYDYWTAGMKTITGNVTHATLAEYIPAVADALAKNAVADGDALTMLTYLRNLGLRDMDIYRIAEQMRRPDGVERFSNGGVLPNMDKWDDPAAYQAYQAAVLTEVNKLIVTPGLERPNVVDENMGFSLLFQFKSFAFGANSRMAMSALQGNDPYLMQGVVFSLALGALSYYTYAISAGGKTLEKANEGNVDEWTWEAVKRSGILGVLSIPGDVGAAVPALSGDDTSTLFRKPSGILGTLLGPTYTQFDRMAEVIVKSGTGDEKQQARNLRALRQVFVPFQNHFLFRQLFDRVGDAIQGN